MRILMIAPQPFFQPRGTPFSVLHRLKAMSQLGYQVDVLTYHLGEDVNVDGVTIHRIPRVPFIKKIAVGPSKRKIILDVYLIFKAIRMLRNQKYDLIHSHEEAGFFSTYLSRKYRALHLYDMHSSLPQQLSNFRFTKSGFLIKLFEWLESTTIDSADAVITICPELFHYVERQYPQQYNRLIENVADNSLVFKPRITRDIRKDFGLNGEAVVLYTGTFEPYQGLDLLIRSTAKVIEKMKDVRFVLVGGKPEQVERYRGLVRELNLEPYFVFTGSILPEEIPAFIEKCDVLVSPRIEGNNTPLKIYSYLRSGKPIVATKHITHTQVLNDEVSILTECTPEGFGAGLLSVLREKQLRDLIVTNAKKLAEQKYSYESYLKKTRDVLDYLESKRLQRITN